MFLAFGADANVEGDSHFLHGSLSVTRDTAYNKLVFDVQGSLGNGAGPLYQALDIDWRANVSCTRPSEGPQGRRL
jgi:hypothetical protein